MLSKIIHLIRVFFLNRRIHATRAAGERMMKGNQGLYDTIVSYMGKTSSTCVTMNDYWELYAHVRKHKPEEILECGTGASTIVMAYALMENCKESGVKGRITSMEEIEKWYEMAAELMPENLKDYVDLVLSPRVEDCYSIFRGVRYKDVPDRPYDFVFVDGPNFEAPSDGHKTFDIDLIDVVKKSSKPVYAIVDNRLATCFVFQKVFGLEKAKYPAHTRLGFIGPCTKDDLKVVESKQCFSESLRVFGNSELDLKMR